MKKIFLLLSLLSLGGCVQLYVPPSQVPLSDVTYYSDYSPRLRWGGRPATSIYIFENDECESSRLVGALIGRKEQPSKLTIKVEANKPLINTFMTQVTVDGVKYWTSKFVPESDRKYIVNVHAKSGIQVFDITSGEMNLVKMIKPKKICEN